MSHFRNLLFVVMMALIPFTSHAGKEVDFNFPQDVSAQALTDLNGALKSGDGQLVVDALVRYSIAQSGISQDNISTVVSRIDSTLALERRSEYRAMLNYFKGVVFASYMQHYARRSRQNAVEAEAPSDYSEWDRAQFCDAIDQCITSALADCDALAAHPLESFKGIINYDNDPHAITYIPTLREFMLMKCAKLADDVDLDTRKKELLDQWVDVTAGNPAANIYASVLDSSVSKKELYERYADNEHVAMVIDNMYMNDKDKYKVCKEYIAKYPDGYYTPLIKNQIKDLESRSASLNYAEHVTSKDSIKISGSLKNVNSLMVNVYRVPDKFITDYRSVSKNGHSNIEVSELKLVSSTEYTTPGTIPFSNSDVKVTLPPLPYGFYIIAPSYKVGDKTIAAKSLSGNQTLQVHDITGFALSTADETGKIITVDVKSGAPRAGVHLKGFINDRKNSIEVKTDANGVYAITNKETDRAEFYASDGDDRYSPEISYYRHRDYNSDRDVVAHVYTDLAIYRPGETVQWSLVLTKVNREGRHVVADKPVRVVFMDHNYEPIDTITGLTDEYGRFASACVVPTDRMNGEFYLQVSTGPNYRTRLTTHSVSISEYKTPTFELTYVDAKYSYIIGQPVKITGKVETFSGMPVANTEVKLQLRQREWSWWWRSSSSGSTTNLCDTIVKTDDTGHFTIEFPADTFEECRDGYRWAHNNYELHAECTDGAGETQQGDHRFIVGSKRGIALGTDELNHVNDKPVKLPLVYHTTSETDNVAVCTWELFPLGKSGVNDTPLATGTVNTQDPTVDLTKFPSGQYTFKVHLLAAEDAEEADDKMTITLYRMSDSKAPVDNSPLWVPDEQQRVDKNNVAHITIGTSVPDAYIYYVAQSRYKVLRDGWIHYKPGIHDFTIDIPNEPEELVTVELTSVYDGKFYGRYTSLISPNNADSLKVKLESFRDKLVPGTPERWTLRIMGRNEKPRDGAMMLSMTDKAINTIAPNPWGLFVSLMQPQLFSMSHASLTGSSYNSQNWSDNALTFKTPSMPYLYMYGQEPFGYMSYGDDMLYASVRLNKSARMAAPMPVGAASGAVLMDMQAEMAEAEAEESNIVAYGKPSESTQAQLDNVQVREADIKTALWMPNLSTDDNGNIIVEFEAPNFNTTWLIKALGWNRDVYSDVITRELVTQKPVMVKSSLPRFVRHGDVVTLSANVQNATDAPTTAHAVIELFDPRTDSIYATQAFTTQLAAKGTQAVSIPWTVPAEIPFVGFRIKAANDNYADGEQVMVPVLENTQPVIETKPFYIEAGQGHYATSIPETANDARLTLEYSDNPVWYCVTALPTIFSDNYAIASSLAHSLFAIEVAQGVAQQQPQIAEAVAYWKQNEQDSTLVSMLARNEDLKIGTLLASPWLRDADRQTLRMSRLDELMNPSLMAKERQRIVTALADMQNSDGGWPWYKYPGCFSSPWTTETVLELIGEIRHLGFMTDEPTVDEMVEKAIKYIDKENLRYYKQQTDKKDYSHFTSWAYIRSLYPDLQPTGEAAKLLKNTLKQMDKKWRNGLSHSEKAFYAMTLNRNGYQATARNIVESLRQFSITKPELGTYWDNLQNGWYYIDKVAVTSTILQAMNEIDPRQQEIDNVRKWMLLMKQTNDWGSSSLAADAVYTLLSTGSKWLERAALPTIAIDGEPLHFSKVDEYVGYCRKTIDAAPGATITIDRTGSGPAWGAIYSQFTAAMTTIDEVAIDELQISKQFYVYGQDGKPHLSDTFKVGDKVQVQLVIKNNRDLDYVTVSDQRAACMEPLDRFSGYRYDDGTYYYHETKDAVTNLFFTSLLKGTHVIKYDAWVMAEGQFSAGIASAQSQYAPQIAAHSAGRTISATR